MLRPYQNKKEIYKYSIHNSIFNVILIQDVLGWLFIRREIQYLKCLTKGYCLNVNTVMQAAQRGGMKIK